MKIETKHTWITAELERQIAAGHYHKRLPPLRSLMKEYNVSLQTISKAIRPLTMSGMISPGPRGSIINYTGTVRERHYAWGILCSGSTEITEVSYEFFQMVRQALARDNHNITFLDGSNKRLQQDTEFWEKQPIDGLVFGYGTLTSELAWAVRRAGIVGVARHHAGNLPVHVVEYDTFGAIDFVLGQIIEKGYRRIALQFAAPLEGYQDYANGNWDHLCDKYGIANPEYREIVMPGYREARERHTQYLCLHTPPEVILCWHSETEETYRTLKRLGLHEKVKLVSYLSNWQPQGHFIALEEVREDGYWQAVREVLLEAVETNPQKMIHRKVPVFPKFIQELPDIR